MALVWCCLGFLGAFSTKAAEAGLPLGYKLLYEQTFADAAALGDFVFSDPRAWRFSTAEGKGALELYRQSQYTPRVRSPVNLALIADRQFGDFVLEAQMIQTGREYGHRDMCVFFDDFSQPSMTATDTHFDAGLIGFGSFDDTGMVANIRVWGPELVPVRSGFFR